MKLFCLRLNSYCREKAKLNLILKSQPNWTSIFWEIAIERFFVFYCFCQYIDKSNEQNSNSHNNWNLIPFNGGGGGGGGKFGFDDGVQLEPQTLTHFYNAKLNQKFQKVKSACLLPISSINNLNLQWRIPISPISLFIAAIKYPCTSTKHQRQIAFKWDMRGKSQRI